MHGYYFITDLSMHYMYIYIYHVYQVYHEIYPTALLQYRHGIIQINLKLRPIFCWEIIRQLGCAYIFDKQPS